MTNKFGDLVDNTLYNFDTEELVCQSHIKDEFLRKFIRDHGAVAKCSYCKRTKTVVELSELLKIIVVGIDYLFEDPNEFKYYDNESETGFDGDNFYFRELFYERLGLNILDQNLLDDIFNYLNNDSLYYDKDEYGSHSEYLGDLWQFFKDTVKHRARYVFTMKTSLRHIV